MNSQGDIQYLRHEQINKIKWDACIAASFNPLIYSCSFYLDHMAKHWDALVLNDYEAVMPLTWNKKWGIYYLYQPFLCASLGIFSQHLTPELTNNFLTSIPPKFRYIDISLNTGNTGQVNFPGLYQRTNFILPLNDSYSNIYNKYSNNVKRNIKKAEKNSYTIIHPPFSEILQLARQQLAEVTNVTKDDFNRFEKLYYYLEKKKATSTYGIRSGDGRLLSSCAFLSWQNRSYYILVGNSARSRATGASHAVINAFIKEHAGTDFVLDFEGSDVPGPALLYHSFGAQEERYPAIQYNRLPAIIKWIKG